MISHGVSINGRGLKQRTALVVAAFKWPEVVKVLLAHGADPAVRDADGNTALAVARDKGNDAVATLLKTAMH